MSTNCGQPHIAGVTAGVLATQGAAWGFAAGIVMVLVVYGKAMFNDERDGTIRTFDEIDPKEGFSERVSDGLCVGSQPA